MIMPLLTSVGRGRLSQLATAAARQSGMAAAQLSTAAHGKIYELRTYSVKPANLKSYVEYAAQCLPIRMKHSPLLGYWTSEVGGLNQVIHIWPYDNFAHRVAVRKALSTDPEWIELAKPMFSVMEKQDNSMLRLFPWSPLTDTLPPGGAYVMYKITFKHGHDISSNLSNFLDGLSGVTVIGAWYEAVGSSCLRNAYAILQCKSLDSPECPINFTSEQLAQLKEVTSNVHSRILAPTSWSPLQ